MTMNETNYKQYDTRWSSLPYPTKKWNIGNSGCGEVAICNSIIEMTAQANQTPASIQPYCVQFAAPNGDGTYWAGIPKMLRNYGCTEVMQHDDMASLWKELEKGNRVAIYMMNNRLAGYNKIRWTTGGHFICSTAYKCENGEHWVYVKDSNSISSDRNGWMTYEGNLRGDVSAVWSGKINGTPAPTPTVTLVPRKGFYTGEYPNPKRYLEYGDSGTEVVKLQKYLNWSFDGQEGFTRLQEDGKYGNATYSATVAFQEATLGKGEGDGKVGQKTIAKMKEYGSYDPAPTPTPKRGKYEGEYPTPKKYLEKGDKGTEVLKWQKYLNWSYGGQPGYVKIAEDSIFGDATNKWTCLFQEQTLGNGQGDGKVGQKTISKAKEYGGYVEPTDPLQKWYDAMTTQFYWSINQIYEFLTNPTIANSKLKGTCITFVAVALQRIGLLPSGAYFYLNPNTMKIAGNSKGVNYVKNHPEIFDVSYPNKTIAQLGSSIKKGDIVGYGNPSYHTMVYMGKNANGQPIFNSMGHTKVLGGTYSAYASRKVNMLVRIKKV